MYKCWPFVPVSLLHMGVHVLLYCMVGVCVYARMSISSDSRHWDELYRWLCTVLSGSGWVLTGCGVFIVSVLTCLCMPYLCLALLITVCEFVWSNIRTDGVERAGFTYMDSTPFLCVMLTPPPHPVLC